MAPHKKIKILAIDPGTRELGMALLEDEQLIHHAVKRIRKGRSPQETLGRGRKLVARFIRDFRPEVLVVEKTFFARNRNVALLNVFTDEIQALARRKGLRVVSFAPSTVKKYICGDGRASKTEVARAVAARFPELRVYLSQDRKWKTRFHANMFDAVALGMATSQ